MKTTNILIRISMCFFVFQVAAYSLYAQSEVNKTTKKESAGQHLQVSFLPFFGTRGSREVVNVDLSLNILSGIVNNVNNFEIGGLANIDRGNVRNVQLAGIQNVVAGSVYGFQVAGIGNISRGLTGTQLAGITNVVIGNASGCQISGNVNIAKQFHGLQIAGIVNQAYNVNGIQIAGIANNSNHSSDVQIAGIVNNCKDTSNVQISGIVNKTSYNKGLQLSLINIADSASGIPIGLISIVKNGYHRVEVSADEIFYTNVAFRTGISSFHNIVTIGIKPDNFSFPLWTIGYGVGSVFGNGKKLQYNFDILGQHISHGDFHQSLSEIYKLYFGVDKHITNKISVAVGATVNIYLVKNNVSDYSKGYSTIAPYTITDNTFGTTNIKSWVGVKASIRFL